METFVDVASKAYMRDGDGKLPRFKQAFFTDTLGAIAGSLLGGTSGVTTYEPDIR